MAAGPEPAPATLVLLGSGEVLDATLKAIGDAGAGLPVLSCQPDSPHDAALLDAARDRAGMDLELVAVAADATPAQRLSRLLGRAAGDVVVLSPGACPAGRAIEQMLSALTGDHVASATPWGNDGELAAFPRIGELNEAPADPDGLAARLANAGQRPELPVPGCHALALSRAGLKACGGLDGSTYFSSYAALVDLGLRQVAMGWRHLLAANAFVVSTQTQGPGLGDMQALCARYPEYGRRVAEFLMADPLRALRAQLAVPGVRRGPVATVSQGDLFA